MPNFRHLGSIKKIKVKKSADPLKIGFLGYESDVLELKLNNIFIYTFLPVPKTRINEVFMLNNI